MATCARARAVQTLIHSAFASTMEKQLATAPAGPFFRSAPFAECVRDEDLGRDYSKVVRPTLEVAPPTGGNEVFRRVVLFVPIYMIRDEGRFFGLPPVALSPCNGFSTPVAGMLSGTDLLIEDETMDVDHAGSPRHRRKGMPLSTVGFVLDHAHILSVGVANVNT